MLNVWRFASKFISTSEERIQNKKNQICKSLLEVLNKIRKRLSIIFIVKLHIFSNCHKVPIHKNLKIDSTLSHSIVSLSPNFKLQFQNVRYADILSQTGMSNVNVKEESSLLNFNMTGEEMIDDKMFEAALRIQKQWRKFKHFRYIEMFVLKLKLIDKVVISATRRKLVSYYFNKWK